MLFVMAYGSDIGEMNPLTWRSERSHWYCMLVYDTLLSFNDDMELIPWLAEDWAVSADGLQVNFTIREGVKWHDGVDLTANDVAFTFEYIRDGPADLNYWSLLQDLTSAQAHGNVVVCDFNQVHSFALHTLGQIYILPYHIRNGYAPDHYRWDDEDDILAHTGSGPFKYVERVPDEYTELEKFIDWWGENNPEVGQLPNIDRVRIDVIIGQDARILAMRNGVADTERYDIFGPYVDEVLTYPELQLVTGVPSQWDYVWGFNLTIEGLNDIVVRRAMALAIDRVDVINVGRDGYGTATFSAIPEAFFPGWFDESGVFEENVALANQILDDAGYLDLDADGTRNYPGNPSKELEFDLMTLSWDDISVLTGEAIEAQMEQIDIEINNIVTVDGPMYDALYTGEYEMYTMAHGYRPIPEHVWWRCHSSHIYEWGDNIYHLDNTTVDTILDYFVSSIPSTITINTAHAAKVVLDNIPYVPLFLSDDTHVIRKEWVNFTTPPGGPFAVYNPRTMIFMYDDQSVTTSTSTTTSSTTTTTTTTTTSTSPTSTTTPTTQVDFTLTLVISIGSIGVIVIVIVLIVRNRIET